MEQNVEIAQIIQKFKEQELVVESCDEQRVYEFSWQKTRVQSYLLQETVKMQKGRSSSFDLINQQDDQAQENQQDIIQGIIQGEEKQDQYSCVTEQLFKKFCLEFPDKRENVDQDQVLKQEIRQHPR